MFFNTLSLHTWQRVTPFIVCAVLSSLALSKVVYASPGAHGPNGEHLDTDNRVTAAVNPKFESFTESFELVGELLETQLVIYLNDFKTNAPIEGADIELESGELSATAAYSELLKAYVLTEQKMLELLRAQGEHEIVLTVMTQDNGDLLVGNLATRNTDTTSQHQNGDHHHLPWFEISIALLVFAIGFFSGRMNLARSAKEVMS